MDNGRYFRINIIFLEPQKLPADFKKLYGQELKNDGIYLGIRANPTAKNQSAAIESVALA